MLPMTKQAEPMFRCHHPGCSAEYQRKSHLNRHERSTHRRQQVFSCSNCGTEFQRGDTLRRHIRTKHQILEPLNRARRACQSCHAGKIRCQGGIPCDECSRRNIQCSFQEDSSFSPSIQESNLDYRDKKAKWIDRYFDVFHPHWPFIHRGSFDMHQENPILLQSMMAIGMWSSGEPSAQSAALQLYDTLDGALRDQRPKWDASDVEEACSSCFWPIATYQAILLHVLLSVLKAGALNLDLKASISASDLQLLTSLIASCRRLGMFFYPNMLARHEEADLPSLVWVGIEEVKRFGVALYKLCSRVNSADRALLHLRELQFPPPSNDSLWHSVGRDDWEVNARGVTISLKEESGDRWISNGGTEHCSPFSI